MHGLKKVTSSRKKPLQSGHLSIYANNIGLTDVRFTRGSYAWFEKGHFFTKETSVMRKDFIDANNIRLTDVHYIQQLQPCCIHFAASCT